MQSTHPYSMPTITFDYAALYYLNWWLRYDRHYCAALKSSDPETQRAALVKAAAVYRVARNLRIKHDKEGHRFATALEIIRQPHPREFKGAQLISTVDTVRRQLCEAYKRKDLLSLTTKFLWLRLQTPIIIYDRNARQALGTKTGDLPAFYHAWKREYDKYRPQIQAACDEILHRPSIHSQGRRIHPDTHWFQERVFDSYLWHAGSREPT